MWPQPSHHLPKEKGSRGLGHKWWSRWFASTRPWLGFLVPTGLPSTTGCGATANQKAANRNEMHYYLRVLGLSAHRHSRRKLIYLLMAMVNKCIPVIGLAKAKTWLTIKIENSHFRMRSRLRTQNQNGSVSFLPNLGLLKSVLSS